MSLFLLRLPVRRFTGGPSFPGFADTALQSRNICPHMEGAWMECTVLSGQMERSPRRELDALHDTMILPNYKYTHARLLSNSDIRRPVSGTKHNFQSVVPLRV